MSSATMLGTLMAIHSSLSRGRWRVVRFPVREVTVTVSVRL
jgi:hypothetical protein